MVLSDNWSRDDDKTLNQQVAHRFQSNTLNRDMQKKPAENYTKGRASSQRPRVERLWLNEWLWVRSRDWPLQQPWVSCSSLLDLQREMIFTGTIYRDPEREI